MFMPWQKTEIEDEKLNFIYEWKRKEFNFLQLCQRYRISRTAGYLLVKKYLTAGLDAFKAKSKAPHNIPHRTDESTVKLILDLKFRFPTWGPVKIKDYIIAEKIDCSCPATSTIGEILKRHGLVKARKRRRKVVPHSEPLKHCAYANAVWSADFKGHFRLKNKNYCYPLTITDNFSRFLFACDGFLSPNCDNTIKTFTRVFKDFGLPDGIRTDNGQPFCSIGLTGLTRLSIWFIKLGITPERISPGAPQENGRHERMHRTLKESVIIPEACNLKAQQKKFDDFIYEYNFLRPHESLEGKRPNEIYTASKKEFPNKLEEVVYPEEFTLRKVKYNGEIKFSGRRYFVSELLHGETLGLEMIDDERAIVYFSKLKIGLIDSRLEKILRPY